MVYMTCNVWPPDCVSSCFEILITSSLVLDEKRRHYRGNEKFCAIPCCDNMEPKKKRTKTEDLELKEMICSMQDIFFNKLKSIEEKIDKINLKYLNLEKKVENIICNIQGIPFNISCTSSSMNDSISKSNAKSKDPIDHYPDGSWLGDPDNPDFRIRSPITPKDLDHINNSCATPEKMSLTLLDYLFSREVQACSNLSGTGKHGKKQLDPDKIEGIKCHVTYMFGISENDWNRIKLNIDSKCRTAFRRKLKGMPLDVRGTKTRPLYKFRKKDEVSDECVLPETLECSNLEDAVLEELGPKPVDEVSLHHVLPTKIQTINLELGSQLEENTAHQVNPIQIETNSISFPISSESEIINTEHGKIQVIRATKEQFELLKQSHNIQVLPQSLEPY